VGIAPTSTLFVDPARSGTLHPAPHAPLWLPGSTGGAAAPCKGMQSRQGALWACMHSPFNLSVLFLFFLCPPLLSFAAAAAAALMRSPTGLLQAWVAAAAAALLLLPTRLLRLLCCCPAPPAPGSSSCSHSESRAAPGVLSQPSTKPQTYRSGKITRYGEG